MSEEIELHGLGKYQRMFQNVSVGADLHRRCLDPDESYVLTYPNRIVGNAVILGQDNDGYPMLGEGYYITCELGYDLFEGNI